MVEPKYKPGWEDIDKLIARRDREDKDPNCGPHPSTGYPRFMWIRSRWGWDWDQWSQHRRVHDTSSACRESDGVIRFYCTCGLIVDMPEPSCRSWGRDSKYRNFHAWDRVECEDCDRAFFSAPGHRDAFLQGEGTSFAARFSVNAGNEVHLWCTSCGDLGPILDAFGSDIEFDREAVNRALDAHNGDCPSGSTRIGREDN